MSLTQYYSYDWEYWNLYHKVTFDGPNKLIIINPDVTSLNVEQDIYSDWKEWALVQDNAKYEAALRTTGGDPLIGTTTLDGYFFLINGWKLVPPDDKNLGDIDIDGNLYDDAGGDIFDITGFDNFRLVRQTVSSKATVIELPVTASVEVTASIPSTTQVTASLAPGQTVATASYVEAPVTIAPGQYVTASVLPGTLVTASLSPTQETMLLELYQIMGLDPTKPLVVSPTERTAGSSISQSITLSGSEYTAQRL